MLRVIDGATREIPPYVSSRNPVEFRSGFHHDERDADGPFRWMTTEGRLTLAPRAESSFLEFSVHSARWDLTQQISISGGAEELSGGPMALPSGWTLYSVVVPPGTEEIRLTATPPLPQAHHPGDTRELAIKLRRANTHTDPERHGHIAKQFHNRVLNQQEMQNRESRLESMPPSLGIDLHGVCNVKPACVYCPWDHSKELEGDNVDTPFTHETLESFGPFFDYSTHLVNCSIGEPFMMKNLDDLLDTFEAQGKSIEMATNGQILTDRNIEKLIDRDVNLFISLDAATPETYACLRNDTFDKIIANLRRLIAARDNNAGRPRINLVFMPMRINVHEIKGFVELCADLGVDSLVLRPLNYGESDLDWDRGGYRFVYQDELLPFEELVQASGLAAALCSQYGVEINDQMDFGGSMGEMFDQWFQEGWDSAFAEPSSEPESGGGSEADPQDHPSVADESVTATTPESAHAPAAPAPSESGSPQDDAAVADAADPLGSEVLPLCTEPWKSLYILRRGVLPCCYGDHPIADMDDFADAWNSQTLQGIRHELAAGRFHAYCLDSPACPIVRKTTQADTFSKRDRMMIVARGIWSRLNDVTFNVPRKIYRPFKRLLGRFAPGY